MNVTFRQAAAADAAAVHRLIADNLEAGHLLPRTLEDVTANIAASPSPLATTRSSAAPSWPRSAAKSPRFVPWS